MSLESYTIIEGVRPFLPAIKVASSDESGLYYNLVKSDSDSDRIYFPINGCTKAQHTTLIQKGGDSIKAISCRCHGATWIKL